VISAYVEELHSTRSAPTVKQHLAAVKMLFDWLVIGQVVSTNPASSVGGPKHVTQRGKTPVLTARRDTCWTRSASTRSSVCAIAPSSG
jgi:site-specific recombinase XerD